MMETNTTPIASKSDDADHDNDDDDDSNNNDGREAVAQQHLMKPILHPTVTVTAAESLSVEDKAKSLYCGEGLGPMVRASTIPLRSLAYKYGADFAYTEELIDRSISSTQRIVNTALGTIDYIKFDPHNHTRITTTRRKTSKGHDSLLILRVDPTLERHRLVCQIGTGSAQHAVQAAIHVYQDVAGIDINMGCPKKFSTGGGMGSALLQDPNRASEIIRTVTNTVSTSSNIGSIDTGSCCIHSSNDDSNDDDIATKTTTSKVAAMKYSKGPIPVSAKIRLLPSIQETIDFITALVNAGVHAIAIHGRHVGNPDVESAYWDELFTVLSIVIPKFTHVQFLINGDFYTRYECTKFLQQTQAAGVLLARPALFNTSIFIKPSSHVSQSECNAHTVTNEAHTKKDCVMPLTSESVMYGYDSSLLLDKTTVVQEYLQEAVRYDGHYKNVKYVICEMMNLRRAPHVRVPYLSRQTIASQNTPTIGTTCAQNSMEELCQIWNVNYHKFVKTRTSLPSSLPGEHTYLDSYLLQQIEQQPEHHLNSLKST